MWNLHVGQTGKKVGENDKFEKGTGWKWQISPTFNKNGTNSPTFPHRQQIHPLLIPFSPTSEGVFADEKPNIGSYTAGTSSAMMHDTGQRALEQAQDLQAVLKLAQPKRQNTW